MRTLLMIAIVALTCTGFAADEKKVAVLDMRAIMSAHPEMASVETLVAKKLEEFNTEKADYQEQFEAMKKELETIHEASENKALSEEARKIKKTQVEEKLVELKQFQLKMKETLKSRREQIEEQSIRMQTKIVNKISGVVGEYAKNNKITMVLNNQTIVYHDETIDITEKIMELLIKESKVN